MEALLTFTDRLAEEMEIAIREPGHEQDNVIAQLTRKCQILNGIMDRLRAYISQYQFRNDAEEIHFFKVVKPRFHKQLIYYAELCYIHSTEPAGERKILIEHYRQLIQRNIQFCERYKLLHSYHKLGRDTEDELLFLRKTACPPLHFEHQESELDKGFCTVNSSILAKLLAFEMVNGYLSQQIESLKKENNTHGSFSPDAETALHWTGDQVAFVELCYALKERDVFRTADNQEPTLKQIVHALEAAFHCNGGNFYRIFQDMLIRKKSLTPFLESLTEGLQRKMKGMM